MPSTSLAYRTALRFAAGLAPAAGLLSPRLRHGLKARSDAGKRLLAWARSHRDVGRPLAWFHAASAGEGLQAEAVMMQFRRRCRECQIVYTHFSPSAEGLAARIHADVTDYLPYDIPADVDRLLEALRPDLLVFAKLDLWPELSTRASNGGAHVAMVAGTVSPGSSRLRWPARAILRPGYRVISAAAAVSTEDGERLTRLGIEPVRIRVLGDPRFDSVVEKVAAISAHDPLLRLGRGAPTLVAGSTWPEDEAVLFRAYAGIRSVYPHARLIVVPHEPREHHLSRLEQVASGAHLPRPVRLSMATGATSLLIVDRVGILAGLYGSGTMAYVGGGFGRAGLHSVLEPAAWSLPVVFGPRWTNSRDAALLLEGGGGVALPAGTTAAAAALEELWNTWIRDETGRMEQGRKAREVVERGRGASESSAEMLLQLISSRFPRMLLNGEQSGLRSTL